MINPETFSKYKELIKEARKNNPDLDVASFIEALKLMENSQTDAKKQKVGDRCIFNNRCLVLVGEDDCRNRCPLYIKSEGDFVICKKNIEWCK